MEKGPSFLILHEWDLIELTANRNIHAHSTPGPARRTELACLIHTKFTVIWGHEYDT